MNLIARFFKNVTLILLLTNVVGINVVAQTGAEGNLKSHFPFNGNANDVVGGFTAQIVGASLTSDRDGNQNSAYQFNGQSYINVNNSKNDFNLLNSGYTVSMWLNVDANQTTSKPRIMGFGGYNDNGWEYQIYTWNNDVSFALQSTAATVCAPTVQVTKGTWQHVSCVYQNGTVKLFLNGVSVKEQSCGSYNPTSSFDLVIGATSDSKGQGFVGKLDDIRFYDVALSDAQVAEISGNKTAEDMAKNEVEFYSNFEDMNLAPETKTRSYELDTYNGGTLSVVPNPDKDAVNSSDYVMVARGPRSAQGSYSRAEYETQWGKPFETVDKKHIYQWKVYFPEDYLKVDTIWYDWQLISQFVTHPCANYDRTQNEYSHFGEKICGTGGIFNEIRIDLHDYDTYRFEFRAEPDCNEVPFTYDRGKWIKLTLEIFWTTSFDGFYNVYANEVLLGGASSVRTLPQDFIEGGECDIRWKVGLYNSWYDANKTVTEYYIDDLELYIDKSIDDICPGCVGQDVVEDPCKNFLLTGKATDTSFEEKDGSIELTVSGGASPYTYSWDDGATAKNRTNIGAGTYKVTVKDAGDCELIKTFTIKELPDPCSTFNVVGQTTNANIGVENGSIILTVVGGESPYSYSWDDGITTKDRSRIGAGTYKVTVKDAGSCEDIKSFVIQESASPCATFSVVGEAVDASYGKDDGTITLTVSGGTEAYSYTWDDGVNDKNRTSLAVGTYKVTVKDADGCELIKSYEIKELPNPCENFGVTADVANTSFGKENGSILLTVAGGEQPYSYNWDDGATSKDRTGLSADTYVVTIKDEGTCELIKTFVIEETADPCESFNVQTVYRDSDNEQNNGSIVVTAAGGKKPYSYQWTDGVTTKDRMNLRSNNYFVKITDSNGCLDEREFTILEKPIAFEFIKRFPNPTDGLVIIEFTSPEATNITIIIRDFNGIEVDRSTIVCKQGDNKTSIDLTTDQQEKILENGMYEIILDNGREQVKKLISKSANI